MLSRRVIQWLSVILTVISFAVLAHGARGPSTGIPENVVNAALLVLVVTTGVAWFVTCEWVDTDAQ